MQTWLCLSVDSFLFHLFLCIPELQPAAQWIHGNGFVSGAAVPPLCLTYQLSDFLWRLFSRVQNKERSLSVRNTTASFCFAHWHNTYCMIESGACACVYIFLLISECTTIQFQKIAEKYSIKGVKDESQFYKRLIFGFLSDFTWTFQQPSLHHHIIFSFVFMFHNFHTLYAF